MDHEKLLIITSHSEVVRSTSVLSSLLLLSEIPLWPCERTASFVLCFLYLETEGFVRCSLYFLPPSEAYSVLRNWKMYKQNKNYSQCLPLLLWPWVLSGHSPVRSQDKSPKAWDRVQLDIGLIFDKPRNHKLPTLPLIFGVFSCMSLYICGPICLRPPFHSELTGHKTHIGGTKWRTLVCAAFKKLKSKWLLLLLNRPLGGYVLRPFMLYADIAWGICGYSILGYSLYLVWT